MQTEIFFSQHLVFSRVLLNPQPGSQIGADFQADITRFLRSKADLPQGRLPRKRTLPSSPASLSRTFAYLPYTQQNVLPALPV